MSKVIAFQNAETGMVSVIRPALCDAVALNNFGIPNISIEEIAKRDVPPGVPYKIIDESNVPARNKRADWTIDFSKPDGRGEDYGVDSLWRVADYVDGKPSILIHQDTKEQKEIND